MRSSRAASPLSSSGPDRRAILVSAFACSVLAPQSWAVAAQDASQSRPPAISPADSALSAAYDLLAAGELESARTALVLAVPLLAPEEATTAIQLAVLVERLPPTAAGRVASAELTARRGEWVAAVDVLTAASDSMPDPLRATLLAHAARVAERGGEDELARTIRDRLVRELPDQPATDEAALELARRIAAESEDEPEAIKILEELVTRRPNGVVAPAARAELERLRRGGGR